MKKILIAIFLATIMLMIPVTTTVKTSEVTKNINVSSTNVDTPVFYVTQDEYNQINNYIELTFQGDEVKKQEAYDIRDNIISTTSDENGHILDPISLAESLITYIGIQPIPEEKLTLVDSIDELNGLIKTYWKVVDGKLIEGIFGELVDKIIQIIKDRLGWIYDLVNKAYTLFKDGIALVYDFIQPAVVLIAVAVVQVVNNIIAVPQLFRDLITELFQLDFDSFIDTAVAFTEDFSTDLSNLIQALIDLVNNPQLKTYLTSIQNFVNWLGAKPWQDPIQVVGVVRYNLGYLVGGTVTCRGISTTTDNNGKFNFNVNPSNTSDTSFPPYEWYGMHDCTITVSKNGEVLKQSLPKLSYVFSGGKIEWPFVIIKSKPKFINLRENLMEIFNNLLLRLQELFPNLFRNINRLGV